MPCVPASGCWLPGIERCRVCQPRAAGCQIAWDGLLRNGRLARSWTEACQAAASAPFSLQVPQMLFQFQDSGQYLHQTILTLASELLASVLKPELLAVQV